MNEQIKFVPKIEKIWETILYVVHKRPNTDHYTISKLIYLSDREHFRRYGRPITFDRYAALPYGPVPSNALNMLKRAGGQEGGETALRAMGIKDIPFEVTTLDKNLVFHTPKRDPLLKKFSKSDLRVLDDIVAKYGDKKFYDLYQITHRHFAYTNAWGNRRAEGKRSAPIAYEDMLELSSSYEQQVEDLAFVAPHI